MSSPAGPHDARRTPSATRPARRALSFLVGHPDATEGEDGGSACARGDAFRRRPGPRAEQVGAAPRTAPDAAGGTTPTRGPAVAWSPGCGGS